MPAVPTGRRITYYSGSCPINNGHDCGRRGGAIRKCTDEHSARATVFNHVHRSPKPNHSKSAEEAKGLADRVELNIWSESEYENLTDHEDEEEADAFEGEQAASAAAPPSRSGNNAPKRRKGERFERVQPLVDLGVGAGVLGIMSSGLGSHQLGTIAPDQTDDQVLSLRRSQLKCVHDCIVRAALSIRGAKAVCERAVTAFELEATNVERIAATLGSML